MTKQRPSITTRTTTMILRSILTALLLLQSLYAAAGNPSPAGPLTGGGEVALTQAQAAAAIGEFFDRLDCESDGSIERLEADDHFSQIWLPTDLDRSRTLSATEFARAHPRLSAADAARLFRHADADGDDAVSVREMHVHMRRLIDLADRDGDRQLSRIELAPAVPLAAGTGQP